MTPGMCRESMNERMNECQASPNLSLSNPIDVEEAWGQIEGGRDKDDQNFLRSLPLLIQ